MANAKTKTTAHNPTEHEGADGRSTSKTIGYDSAQKSGYDTAEIAPDARNTTDEVHAGIQASEHERAEDEGAAQPENHSKSTAPGSTDLAGTPARRSEKRK